MTTEKGALVKRGIPLILIGLLIFIVYLYFFIGVEDIVQIIQRVNPFYYSMAAVSVLLSMLFYSLTWQSLLSLLSIKTTFRKTFLYIWVGTFVDLLIPAESVGGEVSRAYLMSKDTDKNAGMVVASVVSHRILTMAITLSGLIIGSVLFVLRYEPAGLVVNFMVVVGVCSAVSLALLLYLCFEERLTRRIVDWVAGLLVRIFKGRWQLTRLRADARKMLRAFHRGIDVLGGHPKALLWPMTFSIIAWFFDLLLTVLVFVSLGESGIFLSAIIIVYSISNALQAIPIGIPNGTGIIDVVKTSLYVLLLFPQGITPATSAAATVLITIITFWFKLFIGYVAVQWLGAKTLLGGFGANRSKTRRESSEVRAIGFRQD